MTEPDAPPVAWLPEQWEALISEWREPRYRAGQIFRWIHQRGVTEAAGMTDQPGSLRTRLEALGLRSELKVADSQLSKDGTRKLLMEMSDGRRVESVLIPRSSVSDDDIYAPQEPEPDTNHVTQCVSSQVGCAMGCTFCASGIAGLKRQMNAAEILSQVFLARQALEGSQRLSGIVFMGMGEPLHNYDAVRRAITLITHPDGVGMSPRRITVSTSGLVPEMDRLAADFGGRVRLAVSIHAPDSETRGRIMPIEKKYPVDEVFAAMRRYPVDRFARITVEYILIAGINDSMDTARHLARRLRGISAKVNLIPMNPVPGSDLSAPTDNIINAFQDTLRHCGVHTFLRRRKGDDIAAACGQLALHGEPRKIRIR